MQMTWRQCRKGDLEELRTLSIKTFTAAFGHLNTPENMTAYCDRAFGADSLRQQLEVPGSSFWFLYADDTLAGYMKLNERDAQTDIRDADSLEVERIYVSPAFQGRGLGGYMIGQAAQMARDMGKTSLWLGVWEHNTRAIRFYETNGFKKAGSHAFYLGDDKQTDIIMRRELSRTI